MTKPAQTQGEPKAAGETQAVKDMDEVYGKKWRKQGPVCPNCSKHIGPHAGIFEYVTCPHCGRTFFH